MSSGAAWAQKRRRFLLHNVDVAAVVNEMAGQALILHQVYPASRQCAFIAQGDLPH